MIRLPRIQTDTVRFLLPSDEAVRCSDERRQQWLETGDASIVEVDGEPTWVTARLPRGRDTDAALMSTASQDDAARGVALALALFDRCVVEVGPVPGPDGPATLDRELWADAIPTSDRILVGVWIQRLSSLDPAPGEAPSVPLRSSRSRSKRRGS